MADPVNNNLTSVNQHYNDMAAQAMGQRAANSKEATLGMQEFITLLVAQLQNQDMFNPMDNTEFIAQMATFSTLTAINNMADQSLTSYAVSLLGKEITAAEVNEVTGRIETYEGVVTTVSLFEQGGPRVYIGEKSFALQSVMSVGKMPGKKEEPAIKTDSFPDGKLGEAYSFKLEASNMGDAELTWSIANGELPAGLSLSKDGVVSGTPEKAGLFIYGVRVTDGDDIYVVKWYALIIADPNEAGETGTVDVLTSLLDIISNLGSTLDNKYAFENDKLDRIEAMIEALAHSGQLKNEIKDAWNIFKGSNLEVSGDGKKYLDELIAVIDNGIASITKTDGSVTDGDG